MAKQVVLIPSTFSFYLALLIDCVLESICHQFIFQNATAIAFRSTQGLAGK
jgi:hypothetical protein